MSNEEEEAQSRGFKISDRRRFVDHDDGPGDTVATPAADTGRDRAEAATAPAAEPPPVAPVPDPGAGEIPSASEAVDLAEAASAEDPADGAAAADIAGFEDASGAFPEMNFSTFVISLMTQALMHLGEVAEEGRPPTPDLPAAKQMIDLLGILRDKTTGNLDANEEQLLGQMLYDLRMRYVEVSRGS